MAQDSKWLLPLGKMTYGIYALTSAYKEAVNVMIASWVSQVSHDPYLILAGVHPNRYSHTLIEKSGFFALHILLQSQKDLLGRFKGPDPAAKLSGLKWTRGKTGCPILADCICHLECEVTDRIRPGNHTLFLGKVVDVKFNSDDTPLSTLDYRGTYVGDK
jgi:flavin reductase (DIM6/NTAB) family NADH-FMN oxidoreductase RutF